MPGLPELPVNVSPEEAAAQIDGTVERLPIYQTHRGKLPEGHEDTKPFIEPPPGWVRTNG